MSDSASAGDKSPGFSMPAFFKMLNQWRRNNKLKFYAICCLLMAVLAWFLFKPDPETVRVYLNAPGVTNLQLEKPRPDPLVLEFGDSVAKLNQIGKELSTGVSLSPTMQGQWKWTSDRKLVFIPEQEWRIAQNYNVSLDEAMFPSHILLDDYSPSFDTQGFTAALENTEFFQDPQNPKLKKLVSTVRFSHRLDKDDFKSRVKLIMKDADPRVKDKGKDYPYELSFNKVGNEAYIHSKPIAIPSKEQTLILRIDDGARSQEGGISIGDKLSTEVSVPGMYSYFRIGSAEVNLIRNQHNDPEQVLILETTDGVEESVLKNNLELLLLPRDRPAGKGRKLLKNYHWRNVEQIGPKILKQSTSVSFKALPAEHEYAKVHSFRIDVPPKRKLYVRVKKGIESVGGYQLAKTYDTTTKIPVYPRELEIMGKGGVLSLSGDKRISVVSRGNKGVQFEIARVLPGQVQHLISQTGGDFQDPYFSNYNFNQDNISQRYTHEQRLKRVAPGKSQYTSFDLSQYLNRPGSRLRNGIFLMKIHGWDFNRNRRTGVTDKRLILLTDLGMIVKENADKTRDLFVMSIKQGAPVAGAQVKVIGKNGTPTYTTQTDARGRARIPDQSDHKREKAATAYMVNHGGDMSFLPYRRHDRKLDLSRFDIGGVRQHGEKDALSAYLFSDRGIYRPGDTFNIGMIIKSSNWKRDLTGVPLQSVITDPRGLEIKSEKFALSASGFESLSYQSRDSSPTGEYEVRLYLIKDEHGRNLLGSASIKLEEFLPDRMKISSRFSQERALGWVHPKDLAARVNLKNLYGTPATQRRISGSMTLSPYHPVFQKYSAFRFYDPMKAEKGFTERLPESETDDNGEAELKLNLQRFASASYNVSLQVNGFEAEGGRSVSTERSILVSPRDFLVGYKADGKLDYVGKDSQRKVHFIAIDPTLKLSKTKGLKIQLIEQRYVSALVKQDNGTYKYQSVLKEKKLSEKPLSISSKGLDYALPTQTPGDFLLVVRDGKGTELNKVNFSVAGEANLARSLEKNAELQVKLNKRDYEPGEAIKVNIRAPYHGAGLITIERDKVYSYKWFKTNSTNSVQSITLPQGMEGNAYVNVSFVRDLGSREIFMSPLSYGVAPFTISRDARRNHVTLDVPYLMRPGDKVKIAYKAQHAGKIVVFAVDEGILQVANYKTPQPLKHFFRKKALEVETAQLMDLILPEYSVVRQFSAAGGGMYESESKNLNPFKRRTQKPVAYWSGIIDADGRGGKLDYQVPDYFNGSLRFMAVAVSQGSLGVSQKKSLSRGHFVLSPNVPTFVAPGDEFDVSVNVANNVEGSGKGAKVSLTLEPSSHLELVGKAKQQLKIDEGREKPVRFRMRAKQQLGSATFRFVASTGNKQATASVDLSVRPPVTRMVDVSGDSIKKDDVELALKRDMYSEFRERQVILSPVPLGLANGMLRYLDEYPHLCTEQLVSKVFPIVALKDKAEFAYDDKKARASINQVVDILRSRQNGEGAFGFWAANSHVSPKQSIYALHFLREASANGFDVPEEMIKRAFRYAKEQAQKDIDNLADARVRAYAIYQLTEAGEVTTRYLNDMREQMDKFYKDKWEQEISRAYMAAAYKMLHLDKEANDLVDDMELGAKVETDYASFYDNLSRDAQLLYVWSRHFPDKVKGMKADGLKSIVEPVNKGYFNTISSSYSILALDAYTELTGGAGEMDLKLWAIDKDGKKSAMKINPGLLPKMDVDAAIKRLQLDTSASEQPIFYQTNQAGFDRNLPTDKLKQGLEVHREYRNSDGKEIHKVAMGEEVEVRLQLRSLDGKRHYNVAVIDLLPGGFELVRDASRNSNSQWTPDYMDLREDRIVLYGTIDDDAKEFVYRIKATNKGQYVVPPTYAESMYDRKLRYRGLAARMTVE